LPWVPAFAGTTILDGHQSFHTASCRFSDAGNDEAGHTSETGVGKAPRQEIAGEWGTVGAAGSMGI
jgi:hypothetical protein